MSTVLITGALGEVGRGVVPLLERSLDLRLLDVATSDDPRFVRADLLDLDALTSALEGADRVLHLAVATGHSGVYEDDAFNQTRFDVNVKGTYHLFEAARRAGVRRVVHVSSLMVVWGYGAEGHVAGDAPARPVGTYALTKYLGEQVATHYAVAHDMEVIVLRISAPVDVAAAKQNQTPVRPQQIPFADLARGFELALTVPIEQKLHILTLVGESSRRVWDLETAKRVLGYEPSINLDEVGLTLAEPFDVKEKP